MRDYYVFDIPVYRCTRAEYERKLHVPTENHLHRCFEAQGFARVNARDMAQNISARMAHLALLV